MKTGDTPTLLQLKCPDGCCTNYYIDDQPVGLADALAYVAEYGGEINHELPTAFVGQPAPPAGKPYLGSRRERRAAERAARRRNR